MTRPTIQWMDPATRALDNDHIVPRTDRATVREGIENWVAHHIEGWARGAHVLRTRDGEDVYEVLDLQHVMAESDAADSEARDDVREVDTPSGSPGP
jgi:hypothetical protein